MKRYTPVVAAALLTACQTTAYEGNENSPYYQVPVGSRLTLNRDLAIPANQAGVYLQGGQVVPQAQVNMYHPHCKFELRRVPDTALTVRPDEFVITRAVQNEQHSVRAPLQLAAGPGFRATRAQEDGGPTVQAYVTRLNLRSERQPDVLRLNCGQWGYPPHTEHVSIQQIRKALGEVCTLKIETGTRAPAGY
jgi:hypothetical protein